MANFFDIRVFKIPKNIDVDRQRILIEILKRWQVSYESINFNKG